MVLDCFRPAGHLARVAVELLSADQIARIHRAGRAAAETLAFVGSRLQPGMCTEDIDRLVREDTAARGARPSQLGYHGFPAAVCTSKNDVACHGIPSPHEVLRDGDIVAIDVTSELDGMHGDNCATFCVGNSSPTARHVVEVARQCRALGIAQVRPGARLGDVGAAIQNYAHRQGCSVVTQVGGHGIGRKMHMDPHITYAGPPGTGLRLRTGMALTIEPIINLGEPEIVEDDDGWTLRTEDGSWSAQFEHTVLVTPDGCRILTSLDG